MINEVLLDPEGTDTGMEFVELYNNTDQPIDLTGYDLKPDGANYFTFSDFVLESDRYVTIHINAEGTSTQTDLYAGISVNMSNASGSIVLFSSTTHSQSTIVDFMEYGEGGQTWESAAVQAGIWTSGDFAEIGDEEGKSLNLCPNGMDLDTGSNWQIDVISNGDSNPCNTPPDTPTPTMTPTSTATPTITPTPHPTIEPVIYLAGFGNTHYRAYSGGIIQILAWITDPLNDITSVKAYYGGEPILELWDDGNHGDFGDGDGLYGFEMTVPPPDNQGRSSTGDLLRLQIKIVAEDNMGYSSSAWPYLTVSDGRVPSFPAPETPDWWLDASMQCGRYQASSSNGPNIFAAGFMNSRVYSESGGTITLVAVTTGSIPVKEVEMYYNGLPTGVFLQDDGQHADFGPHDGVFGLIIPISEGILPPGEILIQLMARDFDGQTSDLWPYLTISD